MQVGRRRVEAGRLSVRANFAWVTASTLLFQVCQWLMLATLARSTGAATVGLFSYVLAVTTPLILLANLNLRAALSTDVGADFAFTDYFTLRLSFLLVSLLGIAVSSVIFCHDWYEVLLFIAVTSVKLFDAISDIIYGLLEKYERMKYVAVSRLSQGVLQLVALYIGCEITGDLLLAIMCWLLVSAATTLCYDLRSVVLIVREFPEEVVTLSRQRLRSHIFPLFRQALPLAGVAVIGALVANAPIYFLNHWRSPTEVGVYYAQLRLVMVMGLAFTALGQAVAPGLARNFGADSARFWRLLRRILVIAVVNGLLGLFVALSLGGTVLRVLYGPGYDDVDLLIVLVAGSALNLIAMSFGVAMLAARTYMGQFWSVVIQFGVTVGVSAVLVPGLGTSGAALGFSIGAGVYAALLAFVLLFRVRRAAERRRPDMAAVAAPAWSGSITLPRQRGKPVAETPAWRSYEKNDDAHTGLPVEEPTARFRPGRVGRTED